MAVNRGRLAGVLAHCVLHGRRDRYPAAEDDDPGRIGDRLGVAGRDRGPAHQDRWRAADRRQGGRRQSSGTSRRSRRRRGARRWGGEARYLRRAVAVAPCEPDHPTTRVEVIESGKDGAAGGAAAPTMTIIPAGALADQDRWRNPTSRSGGAASRLPACGAAERRRASWPRWPLTPLPLQARMRSGIWRLRSNSGPPKLATPPPVW